MEMLNKSILSNIYKDLRFETILQIKRYAQKIFLLNANNLWIKFVNYSFYTNFNLEIFHLRRYITLVKNALVQQIISIINNFFYDIKNTLNCVYNNLRLIQNLIN